MFVLLLELFLDVLLELINVGFYLLSSSSSSSSLCWSVSDYYFWSSYFTGAFGSAYRAPQSILPNIFDAIDDYYDEAVDKGWGEGRDAEVEFYFSLIYAYY